MNNKKIMILVVSVMAILIVTIGASYAYFTANVTGNTTATATTINTGTMAITYTDGADVSATNWIPGDSLTKTFSVENTGNVATKYTIYLSELINKFGDPTDLVYTLTSASYSTSVYPWIKRGCVYYHETNAGIFGIGGDAGNGNNVSGFRSVISAQ